MKPSVFALVLTFAVNVVVCPSAWAAKDCLGSLRAPLERGGFSGGATCKGWWSLRIRFSGQTAVTGYRIYEWRYVLKGVSGGPGHGGERVLIFSRSGEYLGQYRLDTPPFRKVFVQGSAVRINGPASEGNAIPLDNGPPSSVYFGHDRLGFFK